MKNNKTNEPPISLSEITDFDALYDSAYKCRLGVAWKPSVKQFMFNSIENCLKMEKQLQGGTWNHGKPKPIIIRYPKKREGLSIPFRDRVYQRSLNDLALYPLMTRSFILDNAACQQGKGTDFARARIKKHLWNHYSHYGNSGFVLQIDIHGYYSSMRHDVVGEKFAKHLPEDIHQAAMSVLEHQYKGSVGFNPGSQMVQIAGISALDDVDHFAKEKLHIKHYMRYMDDIWCLFADEDPAKEAFVAIRERVEMLGFEVHPTKSKITPLSKGFYFLGFLYRVTRNGKIVMTLNSDNIRHERKKLVRMAARVADGTMTLDKMRECYRSWRDFASKGNSYKLLTRMDDYFHLLEEGIKNGDLQTAGHVTREQARSGQSKSRKRKRSVTD